MLANQFGIVGALMFAFSQISIVWSLFLIPIAFLGFRLRVISDTSSLRIVCSKIKRSTFGSGEGDPLGFFIGWCYIGYIQEFTRSSQSKIYLISTESMFTSLATPSRASSNPEIPIWMRGGTYENLYYRKRVIRRAKIVSSKEQKVITDQIVAKYREAHGVVVAYISGKAGTGKSTIPMILAQELTSPICFTYDMTAPGDMFDNLYYRVDPKEDHPLIVVIEEVDGHIDRILSVGGIPSHKTIPIAVRSKSEWNTFFDNLGLLYQNLIIIMTSNVKPDDIADQSLLRDGRVSFRFDLDHRTPAEKA